MTIAVGFCCVDGLVLGVDSELTVADESKYAVRKGWYLRFPNAKVPAIRIGVVGSGDIELVNKFVELLKARIKPTMTLEAVEETIEQLLLEIEQKYQSPLPTDDRPSFNALLAVRVGPDAVLLRTDGLMATPVEDFEAIGMGTAVADFVVRHEKPGPLTVAAGVLFACRVLLRAKKHVVGCGGPSRLIVVYNNRDSGDVKTEHVEACERFIEKMDDAIRPVLLAGMDFAVNSETFKQRLAEFAANVEQGRVAELQDLRMRLNRPVSEPELATPDLLPVGSLGPPDSGED